MKCLLKRVFVLTMVLTSVTLVSADEASEAIPLQKQLDNVRAQITQAQQDMARQTKELWNKQHDLEYKDPECVKLREEIAHFEKQLAEKRKELSAQLSLLPEMKEIERKRKELFTNLQDLKENERLILNEIAAESGKAKEGSGGVTE